METFGILLFATAYVVAWWTAVWLFLGQPRLPVSSPFVTVVVLYFGIGVPLFLHQQVAVMAMLHRQVDLQADQAARMWFVPYLWAGLPVPILALYGACSLMHEALGNAARRVDR